MKIIIQLALITGLVLTSFAYAEIKAPDKIVTKADINNCLKHLKKTENFLYPHSLKVESASYILEDSRVLLTLSLSEKTEYGGNAGVQEKQCVIDRQSAKSNAEEQQGKSSKKATTTFGSSYNY